MIKGFRSKALERFWWKGDARRIDPRHADKLRLLLGVLDTATRPEEMNLPGCRFHRLYGAEVRWSVWVDKNWRLAFAWSDQGPDAIAVDYEDYH